MFFLVSLVLYYYILLMFYLYIFLLCHVLPSSSFFFFLAFFNPHRSTSLLTTLPWFLGKYNSTIWIYRLSPPERPKAQHVKAVEQHSIQEVQELHTIVQAPETTNLHNTNSEATLLPAGTNTSRNSQFQESRHISLAVMPTKY